jgi:hypothetical protein
MDSSYVVARFEPDFRLRSLCYFIMYVFHFALSERKNGKQKIGKHHSAEGKTPTAYVL